MLPSESMSAKSQFADDKAITTGTTTFFFGNEEPAKPSGFIVALPTPLCFALSFPSTRWRAKPSTQSIAFDLEPYMPIDAESMAIDMKSTPTGWLALVSNSTTYQNEVETLRAKGHWFVAACPLVMLALDGLDSRIPRVGKCIVLWQNAGSIDFIEIQERVVCGWRWLTCKQAAILRAVEEFVLAQGETSLICVGLDEACCETLRSTPSVSRLEGIHIDLHAAARDSAQKLAVSGRQPRFSLRSQALDTRDSIAPVRVPLIACVSALSFMLVCLVVGLNWRHYQNTKSVRNLQEKQVAVFNRLFPGERVPVGLLTRIESEHRQLLATKGAVKNSPQIESVLPALHAFLSGTPADGPRFRWDRLEFSPSQLVRATGVAKSFGDYEAVGASLREAGFMVPPLSALQVNDGVSMRLERIDHVRKEAAKSGAVVSNEISENPVVAPR